MSLTTSTIGTERTDQLVVRSALSEKRTLLTPFCVNSQGAGLLLTTFRGN